MFTRGRRGSAGFKRVPWKELVLEDRDCLNMTKRESSCMKCRWRLDDLVIMDASTDAGFSKCTVPRVNLCYQHFSFTVLFRKNIICFKFFFSEFQRTSKKLQNTSKRATTRSHRIKY